MGKYRFDPRACSGNRPVDPLACEQQCTAYAVLLAHGQQRPANRSGIFEPRELVERGNADMRDRAGSGHTGPIAAMLLLGTPGAQLALPQGRDAPNARGV